MRSLWYGRIKVLKPAINKGYLQVELRKDGKRKGFLVHRLVVTSFIGPIPKGMEVNHINEDKRDNRLENLELVTHKENINFGTRNERVAKQIDLLEADWPYTELRFKSTQEVSAFFGYKHKETVGDYISKARKRGRNFINLRKKKYFFSQAD